MITIKEPIEDIINGAIDSLDTYDTISAWNEYCQRDKDFDATIYRNGPSFFYENYSEDSMWSLVRNISQGNYNSNHNLVCYSKHTGHLNSFDYLCDELSPYDQSALVAWIIRTYGDNLEEIGEFLGTEVKEDYNVYTVGDTRYKAIKCDEPCLCERCVFNAGKSCKASDLFDAGVLPQCDEDGIGYACYWIEVKND
jgi:hypothetical protein